MKYLNMILAAVLVSIVALQAAQDTALTQREVRDPRKLEVWLEANAGDAETRIAALEAAGVGGTLDPAYIIVGSAASNATGVAVSGDVTIATNGAVTIGANKVVESMLKAVNTASDEDFLSYESTTGDFEWHSAAEILAKFAGVPVAPAVSPNVNALTNTVTITNKDTAGNTLVAKRLIRVWVSEETGGVPSTNNIESITVSAGTQIHVVTAAADVYVLTTAGGTASVGVIGTAAGTNYVNVADGGFVTSAALVFEAGE